jgi:hypothetical protein
MDSIMANCTFTYTSNNQVYILDGYLSRRYFNLDTSTNYLETSDIKLGPLAKEFEFTKNIKYYYMTSSQMEIIYEGSSKYIGTTSTYSITIVSPLESLDNGTGYIVKGVVNVSYTRNGVNGSFTIDYGNGTKDSLATITENGQSYQVDYIALENELYNSLD